MSNFIDYSNRGRGNPSPQASIAHDNSTHPDDPFSETGASSNAPRSEVVPANNYSSPYADDDTSQGSYGNGRRNYGGHGGSHIETEHVHTMGDTAQPQYNDEAFFDPSFGGECSCVEIPEAVYLTRRCIHRLSR